MHIGILCEGVYDIEPLKIIISRVIENIDSDVEIKDFIEYLGGGSIINKIESAFVLFFESKPKCTLAVFLSDVDKDRKKYGEIVKKVEKYFGKKNSSKIVIGCPDPTFEQWFFSEEIAVKKVFNLPGEKPLPFKKNCSKNRFKKIYDEESNPDITKTIKERYYDVAKSLDLKLLCKKNKTYRKFHYSLIKSIKSLS